MNQSLPLTELTTTNPLDGRYREKTLDLVPFVSEYALIKTRMEVEALYLIALSEGRIIRKITKEEEHVLKNFGPSLSLEDCESVKTIERETRHDVKAMERAFRHMLKGTTLEDLTEWIHFGLTSEDVNNLSYRLMIKRATRIVLTPTLNTIITTLTDWAEKYASLPMLARTHGQAAVPTTVGKELMVFANRLQKQTTELSGKKLDGKLSGAVGNFNAVVFTYPDVNWIEFSENFIRSLELEPNLLTTQINTYEDIASYLQNYQRINSILLDFNQDMWRYISDEWFVQTAKKGEVGSSTMPQKVNPIDFENSEGNLGMANTIAEYMARKLPISRLQRDLSDSTVMRNIGVIFGYSMVGYKSILTGLSRISVNEEKITKDLQKDWTILSEGVQTLLRSNGVSDPYSLIATLTRGKHISQNEWKTWVNGLAISDDGKKRLQTLSPQTYIGLATQLTKSGIENIRKTQKSLHEK
ncbi:MAG: adenylosuccinate lyase [Candidatus Levybacteria bacterium]|nr:adenylosuccinate lyase [Candidatus Levybacteria bacterium]